MFMESVIYLIIIAVVATILGCIVANIVAALLPYILAGLAIFLVLALFGIIGNSSDDSSYGDDSRGYQQSYPDKSSKNRSQRQYRDRTPQQAEFHQEALEYAYKKPGVNMNSLQPAMDTALIRVAGAFQQVLGDDYTPTITSGDDYNGHVSGSAHYSGAAIDFRLKDIEASYLKEQVASTVREVLGDRFFVDYENPDEENEHLHVQLRQGYYSKVCYR